MLSSVPSKPRPQPNSNDGSQSSNVERKRKGFLHISVDRKLLGRFNRLVPSGQRSVVMRTLLKELCELLEHPQGQLYLAAFITGQLKLTDILNRKKDEHA